MIILSILLIVVAVAFLALGLLAILSGIINIAAGGWVSIAFGIFFVAMAVTIIIACIMDIRTTRRLRALDREMEEFERRYEELLTE